MEKLQSYEQGMASKFGGGSKCYKINKALEKITIIINESYFWRTHRKFHTILTFNHYTIVILYFTIATLCLALVSKS